MLNGAKTFISNGQLADVVIVVAKTDLNAKKVRNILSYCCDVQAAHGISLILVDANTPGFTKGRNLKKIGLKAQVHAFCCILFDYFEDTSELFFDNVRVPKSAVLGMCLCYLCGLCALV